MFKKLSKVHLRARGDWVSFYLHHFPHKVYSRIVIWTRTRQENKIILHYTEQTCLASLNDILMQSAWSPSKPCWTDGWCHWLFCAHCTVLGAIIMQCEGGSRSRRQWNPVSRCCWSRISMSAEQERGCSDHPAPAADTHTHTHTQASAAWRGANIDREEGWHFGRRKWNSW